LGIRALFKRAPAVVVEEAVFEFSPYYTAYEVDLLRQRVNEAYQVMALNMKQSFYGDASWPS
jgi:hypothetical protein